MIEYVLPAYMYNWGVVETASGCSYYKIGGRWWWIHIGPNGNEYLRYIKKFLVPNTPRDVSGKLCWSKKSFLESLQEFTFEQLEFLTCTTFRWPCSAATSSASSISAPLKVRSWSKNRTGRVKNCLLIPRRRSWVRKLLDNFGTGLLNPHSGFNTIQVKMTTKGKLTSCLLSQCIS